MGNGFLNLSLKSHGKLDSQTECTVLDHGTKILLNTMFSSHYNYNEYFVRMHLSNLGFSGRYGYA